MSTSRSSLRRQHVGKTPKEHEAYFAFLRKKLPLTPTVDKDLLDTTKDSSFRRKDTKKIKKLRQKSLELQARDGDIWKNPWVIGVGTGLIVILVTFLVNTYIQSRIDSELGKTETIALEERLKDAENKSNELDKRYIKLDKDLSILKVTMQKEVEKIVERINLIVSE